MDGINNFFLNFSDEFFLNIEFNTFYIFGMILLNYNFFFFKIISIGLFDKVRYFYKFINDSFDIIVDVNDVGFNFFDDFDLGGCLG